MRFEAGQSLGRYRVDAAVGRGGMGEVYKGWDTELGRVVAIKTLREDAAAAEADATLSDEAERAQTAALAARFAREGKLASRFLHPGFCAVLDVGEAADAPFIVMEWIDGEPLRAFITRTGVGTPRKLAWLRALAEALADAHRAGIIHRDFKPGNVMITSAGAAKILDFGLAKRMPRIDDTVAVGPPSFRTATGAVLGTARYMAPEQLAGAELTDARADQFAWGVTAYELLSGTHPALALERGAEPFPIGAARSLDTLVPDLPAGVAALVAKTHEALPSERFESMDALVRELAAAIDQASAATATIDEGPRVTRTLEMQPSDSSTRRRSAKKRSRRALFGASAALTVLVAGAASGGFALWARRSAEKGRSPSAGAHVVAAAVDASAPAARASADATASGPTAASGAPPPATTNAEAPAPARTAHAERSPIASTRAPSRLASASAAEPPPASSPSASPRPVKAGPRRLVIVGIRATFTGYGHGMVVEAMDKIRPQLERCYDAPSYDGRNDRQVALMVFVAENGTVAQTTVAASAAVEPGLARCIETTCRALRLPPHPRSKPAPFRAYLEIR